QQLTDEDLVRLAQEHGNRHPAAGTLLLRYYAWVERQIARQARRRWLTPDLIPDAQQDGMLSVLEAVAAFDSCQRDRPKRCSFRTFLWTMLHARFCDFVRNLRRSAIRLTYAADPTSTSGAKRQRPSSSGQDAWTEHRRSDPAAVAEFRELMERLQQA